MLSCFFFNDTATTEIYTLSLHDALPIYAPTTPDQPRGGRAGGRPACARGDGGGQDAAPGAHPVARVRGQQEQEPGRGGRSEEHTSELQSRQYLVCRLLLEKKKIHSHTVI